MSDMQAQWVPCPEASRAVWFLAMIGLFVVYAATDNLGWALGSLIASCLFALDINLIQRRADA